MFTGLNNIVRVVRPRHLLKAILHPMEEINALRYHYIHLDEGEFVEFLSNHDRSENQSVFNDLDRQKKLVAHLDDELRTLNPAGFGQRSFEWSAIYRLVRLLRPDTIVETGVADGRTTAIILLALEENGKGMLYSIDVPYPGLPSGKMPGWIIPEELRKRWRLTVGSSAEHLKPLLQELKEIDIFFHDSLHTYDNMMFEFETAWPRIKPGGLFLADDTGRNSAFLDFIKQIGIPLTRCRVYEDLAGVRKQSGGRK